MRRLLRILGNGSELHRQTYLAWRAFPLAMAYTCTVFFNLGMGFATLLIYLLGGMGNV